jgi:hypothetical protein
VTTARQYWDVLRTVRNEVALLFGVDMARTSREVRAADNGNLVPVAALAKALVDKGVLMDSDIETALSNAVSADGSFWDPEPPEPPVQGETAGPWDTFPGETFEGGVNGVDASALNTAFAQGPVGDSLLSADGSMKFDSSTAAAGSLSLKTITNDGTSRGLATPVFDSSATLFARAYFKATTIPPSSAGVRILSFRPDLAADAALEVNIDGDDGLPSMVLSGGVGLPDATMPNVCDGAWWRVEVGFYATTLTPQCELRLYTGANLTGTTMTAGYQGGYDGSRASIAVVGHASSRLVSGDTWTCWLDNVAFSTSGWIGP